jgi:arginase family enzyme
VVWFDAHGDLNTPETSPSGNEWGMPLRMAIDEGSVQPVDVALVGARDLDQPELEYVAVHGIDDDLDRALDGVDVVYVALDVDVFEPGAVSSFMPAPGGMTVAEVDDALRTIASRTRVAGLGLTGLAPDVDPATLADLAAAAGL